MLKNGVGVALLAGALAAAHGCGGTETTGPGGSGGGSGTTVAGAGGTGTSASTSATSTGATGTTTSSSTSSAGTGGSAPMCTPGDGVVLAVDKLDFGDVGMDTTASQALGFDIDGLNSTPASTDLCIPAMGASKASVYQDGENGIDNSFGKNVLPLLLMVQSGFSANVNDTIAMGNFTMMFDFVGLTPAADQPTVVTKLYGGAPLLHAPSYDGADCWPVVPELLSNASDITSSSIVFDKSSLLANKWSSGVPATVTLTIPVGPATIKLTIHQATVKFTIAPDHKSASAGRLGGVLDTEEFIKEIKTAIYAINSLYCLGVGQIESSIRQAQDILLDMPQDPTKSCNGISIGFAFSMQGVQLGGVGPKAAPAAGACP